jgi:hypothetical protein
MALGVAQNTSYYICKFLAQFKVALDIGTNWTGPGIEMIEQSQASTARVCQRHCNPQFPTPCDNQAQACNNS